MSTFEEQSLSDYCRIISEFRGLQAGCRFAEAFHAHRIHSFMLNFKLLPQAGMRSTPKPSAALSRGCRPPGVRKAAGVCGANAESPGVG